MIAVLVETSTPYYEVGILNDHEITVLRSSRFESDYAGLPGLVRAAVDGLGLSFGAIDLMMVNRGPGNMISVRSGIAYSNAFTYAAGIPLYTTNSLRMCTDDIRRGMLNGAGTVAVVSRPLNSHWAMLVTGPDGTGTYSSGTMEEISATLQTVPELTLGGPGVELMDPDVRAMGVEIAWTPSVQSMKRGLDSGSFDVAIAGMLLPLAWDSPEMSHA